MDKNPLIGSISCDDQRQSANKLQIADLTWYKKLRGTKKRRLYFS